MWCVVDCLLRYREVYTLLNQDEAKDVTGDEVVLRQHPVEFIFLVGGWRRSNVKVDGNGRYIPW